MTARTLRFMGWLVLGVVASAADAQTLRVTADRTNLRDRPAATGAVVTAIAKGDELTVVERAGTWFKVRTASGTEGYVSSLLVETVAGGAPPAATSPVAAASAAARPTAAAAPATAPRAAASAPMASAPAASAPEAVAPAATQVSAPDTGGTARTAVVRVLGGVSSGYGDLGFLVGAGAGLRPFGNRRIEIALDGLVGRSGESFHDASGSYDVSTTLLAGAGTLLYNFAFEDLGFTPFAGLGATIARATVSADSDRFDTGVFKYSGSGSALHVSAGLEKSFGGSRAFRAEYRSTFQDYGYGGLLLFGLTF